MRRVLTMAAILIILGLMGQTPAMAISIDLMTAGQYNTFIFGNFTGYSDTQGLLAVGGNATLSGYSVADQVDPSFTGDSLVVGGNLNYDGGRVYTGNVVVGGTANVDSGVTNGFSGTQTLTQGVTDLPINFANEYTYLTDLSSTLSSTAATGTAGALWGGVRVQGDGTSNLQIFNLNGNDLSTSTWWHALSGIPDDAVVVFNVSGTNVTMTGGQQVLASLSSNVLFNFYEAEVLNIYGISVEGSILAPYATINNGQGVVQGNVIAQNLSGNLQQNLNPFVGYDDGTGGGGAAATPEPATLALLASGLGGAMLAARRRRRVTASA